MTRFADQLFDDLMREHGQALAHTKFPPAPKRHLTARPVLLTAGAGGVAVAAAIGTLVAGGGTPAYAVTTHPDGTVTLAVYQESGIAGANSKLHQLGDRVVVVPVRSGCPNIDSLPAPGVPTKQISVQASGSSDVSVTVDAQGVPAGDILVLGLSLSPGDGGFQFSMQESTSQSDGGRSTANFHAQATFSHSPIYVPTPGMTGVYGIASKLTSGPAPSCVSFPALAPGAPGGTRVSGSVGAVSKS